ncbi:hypothetical protein M885DRAFT_327121 [Pelagophyceae sp. CCMP2097]|nr:hypothetical protein M885DRAFT_327121 [Pelagophyceae sp. CCMP2097]
MQANFCLGGLRGVLRGAPLLSFRAERIAPLLCGLLRSHIADDPDVAAMVRSGLLAPTESFAKDSPLWAPHARVKAFLRKWHLDSQYRTTSRYKFICESMRGLRGGHGLPSARQVRKLFRLETWERGGDDDRRKRQLLAQALKDDSTRDWTVEDLLEAAGGCVHGHNEFNTYCENQSIYDFYTSDFVDALARRVREANPGAAGVSVVEVGAGDGALAHHLRSRLGNVSVVATDSGKWFVPPLYHVESLDVAAA